MCRASHQQKLVAAFLSFYQNLFLVRFSAVWIDALLQNFPPSQGSCFLSLRSLYGGSCTLLKPLELQLIFKLKLFK